MCDDLKRKSETPQYFKVYLQAAANPPLLSATLHTDTHSVAKTPSALGLKITGVEKINSLFSLPLYFVL